MSKETMKSMQQALAMAKMLEKEANDLPDENYFGDSNASEKEQSRAWAFALREYAQRGTMPSEQDLPEVRNWITGEEWSALEDYEEGE